jgi:hypothetical protein
MMSVIQAEQISISFYYRNFLNIADVGKPVLDSWETLRAPFSFIDSESLDF